MPVYIEYLLKTSLCLAIIFLFYTLLLKRITYYTWNRYFLLFFSILSFIVPFINVRVFVQEDLNDIALVSRIPSINSYSIVEASASGTAISYWQIVSAVFLLVSAILLVRLGIQLYSIKKIRSKATLLTSGEIKLYHLSDSTLPFSFLDSIFINTYNYPENELQEIVHHEQVHVQQNHTLDVLVTELICIFNWFNPFAWLIKKAVRENLEFIADDAVISKGVNKKNYQYLLLKVTGNTPLSITSSLTFSSLKNRILMMNKTKTSNIHLLRFMLLIPVFAILLLAFRNSEEPLAKKEKPFQIETYTLSALTYAIPDENVKSIVLRDKDQSFLKTGEVLQLSLVSREKSRLQSLLERNGYKNLKSNVIRFMIDTTSVNNSFSVEVNINLEASTMAVPAKNRETKMIAKPASVEGKQSKPQTSLSDLPEVSRMYSYLNGSPKKGC